MDPDSKRLRVSVTDAEGRPVRDGGLARWLARIGAPRARGDVAVALVSDARVRTLNREYRRRDRATDVLAFPADRESRTAGRRPRTPTREPRTADRAPRILGDIVIARGVARRQAREAGHSEQIELRLLALHGLLHLLGYDHHDASDRGRMARVEARLRRRGGLPPGLIERSGGGRRMREMDA